jgi:hypothetical protein
MVDVMWEHGHHESDSTTVSNDDIGIPTRAGDNDVPEHVCSKHVVCR